MIRYELPLSWINYDFSSIQKEFVGAKSSIKALRMLPYQREWVEGLQQMELKREVAGTSRIEGAEFTEQELEEALKETPEKLLTRSQKQAHAAVQTYRWIATLPDDRPINGELINEIHCRIISGADDDHCPPGVLRGLDENVNFGQPRHRGVSGGPECNAAFERFCRSIISEYKEHDMIIQALAAHYHFVAMHPFLDGNGRSGRALEALMLQRAGLKDICFIAMSNYYYDEKTSYLNSLSASRAKHHDLTPFLKFAFEGISLQSRRIFNEIKAKVQKEIFQNFMYGLFGRLQTPKKRVIADRQITILKLLLENDLMEFNDLYNSVKSRYQNLKTPLKAYARDLMGLNNLGAIKVDVKPKEKLDLRLQLEWPTTITETEFMDRIKKLPKAKTFPFVR